MIIRIFFTAYFWLMFMAVTLVGLMVSPLFLLVSTLCCGRTVDAAIRRGICRYGWVLVKVVPFLAPVGVESRTGKLPFPVIFVPNHSSAVDPYLFGAVLTDVCFVTTWPFKIPVYKYFMRLGRFINANEGWETVSRKGAAMLRSGASLIIWPEGHRSRDGRLGRFKNGAFALAVETGYPLVPVCILGSRKFLPPGRLLLSPSVVRLILLEPVYPDPNNDPQQEIIRLRHTVEAMIRAAQGENEGNAADIPYSEGLVRGEKC